MTTQQEMVREAELRRDFVMIYGNINHQAQFHDLFALSMRITEAHSIFMNPLINIDNLDRKGNAVGELLNCLVEDVEYFAHEDFETWKSAQV